MKKILFLILLAITLILGKESTYLRKSTESQNGIIVATYVDKSNDTIQTVNIPGTMIPYNIVVQDGVIISNPGITIFPKVITCDTCTKNQVLDSTKLIEK